MTSPRVSIVIPAYNEEDSIGHVLRAINDWVDLPKEVIVVVDMPDDTTIRAVERLGQAAAGVRVLVQDYGRGPANAIRYGLDNAASACVVVTMADSSDDIRVLPQLVALVERGFVIAAASRYMAGGAQIGGPRVKKLVSRMAGQSLYVFARTGTHDATNSYKAYSSEFVREVGVDSTSGFEIGIELVAKARRLGLPIAEVPAVWMDRAQGVSRFEFRAWLPYYLRWYRFAYGPRLSLEELHNHPVIRKAREESPR